MKKSLLVFLALFVLQAQAIQSTQSTLVIRPGQKELILSVFGNPATGYDWQVKEYEWAYFNLVGHGFLKIPGEGHIGTPGFAQFIFKIEKPFERVKLIKLELKGQDDGPPLETKTFRVMVMKEHLTIAEN